MKKRILMATLLGTFAWLIVMSVLCSHASCKFELPTLPNFFIFFLVFVAISNFFLVGLPALIIYFSKSVIQSVNTASTKSYPEEIDSLRDQKNINISMNKYSLIFCMYFLLINIVFAIFQYVIGKNVPSMLLVITGAASCLSARKYFQHVDLLPSLTQIKHYSKLSTTYVALIQVVAGLLLTYMIFGRTEWLSFLTSDEIFYFYGILVALVIAQYLVIKISFSWYIKKLHTKQT